MGLKAQVLGGPYDGTIIDMDNYPAVSTDFYMPPRRKHVFQSWANDTSLPPPLPPPLEVHKRRYGLDGELYFVHESLLRAT